MVSPVVPVRGLIEPWLDKTAVQPTPTPPEPPGGPPIYTWHVPDRECVARLKALECFVQNQDESIQYSMDFTAWLTVNGTSRTIDVINHITAYDEQGQPVPWIDPNGITLLEPERVEVVFGIAIPDGTAEQDVTVIAQVIDSNGNQVNGCGCLRVRHC